MSTTNEQYTEAMASLRDYGERTDEDLLNTVGAGAGSTITSL